MNRRQFIRLVGVATAGASMLPIVGERDEYQKFLDSVRSHVIEIVRREGRGIHRMWIDPVNEGTRKVNLRLVAGSSLLDKLYFTWDEPWYG